MKQIKFVIVVATILLAFSPLSAKELFKLSANIDPIKNISITESGNFILLSFYLNSSTKRLINSKGEVLLDFNLNIPSSILPMTFSGNDSIVVYSKKEKSKYYIEKFNIYSKDTSRVLLETNSNIATLVPNLQFNRYIGIDSSFSIFCWDAETGKQILKPDSALDLWCYSVSASQYSGKVLCVQNNRFIVYDFDSGKVINNISTPVSTFFKAYFHKDGQLVSIYDQFGEFETYNIYSGELKCKYKVNTDLRGIKFFANDSLYLAGNTIYKTISGEEFHVFNLSEQGVLAYNLLVMGDSLFAIVGYNNLYICNLKSFKVSQVFDLGNKYSPDFTNNNEVIGWSMGGNSYFTCNFDKSNFKEYRMPSSLGIYEFINQKNIFTCKYKDTFYLFDVTKNEIIESYSIGTKISDFRFSDDLKYCSFATNNGKTNIMNWQSKVLIDTACSDCIFSYYFSPDSYYCFSMTYNNPLINIIILESSTGKIIKKLAAKSATGADFSKDGKFFIKISINPTEYVIYSIPSFDSVGTIKMNKNWEIYPIHFSNDNKNLIVGTYDTTISFVSLDSNKVYYRIGPFNTGIISYSISEDQRKIVVGLSDGSILLYDIDGILDVPEFFGKKEQPAVFPNPASSDIFVSLPQSLDFSSELKIVSLDGREVYSANLTGTNGIFKMNVSFLPDGVYILNVKSKSENYRTKFVVLK